MYVLIPSSVSIFDYAPALEACNSGLGMSSCIEQRLYIVTDHLLFILFQRDLCKVYKKRLQQRIDDGFVRAHGKNIEIHKQTRQQASQSSWIELHFVDLKLE